MNLNPYESPKVSNLPGGHRSRNIVAYTLAALSFAALVAFGVTFFLSTRFFWEGRIPSQEAKGWIWTWLPVSFACWATVATSAIAAIIIRRSWVTIAVLILAALPLALPVSIIVRRIVVGHP